MAPLDLELCRVGTGEYSPFGRQPSTARLNVGPPIAFGGLEPFELPRGLSASPSRPPASGHPTATSSTAGAGRVKRRPNKTSIAQPARGMLARFPRRAGGVRSRHPPSCRVRSTRGPALASLHLCAREATKVHSGDAEITIALQQIRVLQGPATVADKEGGSRPASSAIWRKRGTLSRGSPSLAPPASGIQPSP